MKDKSMNVNSDTAITKESRYHKKRPKKANDLRSSVTEDYGTDEDGIVVTDDDVISPQKSTAQVITLVETECSPRHKPPSKYNPSELLIVRPTCNKLITFQSFRLPTKKRLLVGNSSVRTETKKFNITEQKRKHANMIRKLPLYRMKNELKRQLTNLEKKLNTIKKREAIRKLQPKSPKTPPIETPVNLARLFSTKNPGKRQLSAREIVEQISENTKTLKRIEPTNPLLRDGSKARSVSSRATERVISVTSPLVDEEEPIVPGKESEPKEGGDAAPTQNPLRVKNVKRSKDLKLNRKPKKAKKVKKHKANLKGFKQMIPIDGTKYTMEIILEQELIDKTRKGKFDVTKGPIHDIRTNKSSELRDEYTSYCGKPKYIKNWLFQV